MWLSRDLELEAVSEPTNQNFFENRRVKVNLTLHFFHEPFYRGHKWDSQKNMVFTTIFHKVFSAFFIFSILSKFSDKKKSNKLYFKLMLSRDS